MIRATGLEHSAQWASLELSGKWRLNVTITLQRPGFNGGKKVIPKVLYVRLRYRNMASKRLALCILMEPITHRQACWLL